MLRRCYHVPFRLIITGVAVHVRKVAHPKYPKMLILEEYVELLDYSILPCLFV